MEKKNNLTKSNVAVTLCVMFFAVLASCSITFYNQWHTVDSYIKTENPTTNSADSASINIQFPKVSTE